MAKVETGTKPFISIIKKWFVGFGLLALFLCIAIFGYWASCPLPSHSDPVQIDIPEGSSTREVGELLHSHGIIRSPFLFRVLARIQGADGSLKMGEYVFEPGLYVWDTISSLVRGQAIYYTITVREGLTVEEIGELIEERGFGSKDRFLELVTNPLLVADYADETELAETRYPVEGYLFPDTYYVRKGTKEEEFITMMLRRFSQVFDGEIRRKAKDMNLTPHQVCTLAAIVEKEAMNDEERPVIAAVFLNRIKYGMRLDADPTVLYAAGKTCGPIYQSELESDSPFNTYVHTGLPPGPISNFGKACLEAVVNPASVDYLYFVSKNDGTHAFSTTLYEHNQNVARYQR